MEEFVVAFLITSRTSSEIAARATVAVTILTLRAAIGVEASRTLLEARGVVQEGEVGGAVGVAKSAGGRLRDTDAASAWELALDTWHHASGHDINSVLSLGVSKGLDR